MHWLIDWFAIFWVIKIYIVSISWAHWENVNFVAYFFFTQERVSDFPCWYTVVFTLLLLYFDTTFKVARSGLLPPDMPDWVITFNPALFSSCSSKASIANQPELSKPFKMCFSWVNYKFNDIAISRNYFCSITLVCQTTIQSWCMTCFVMMFKEQCDRNKKFELQINHANFKNN